MAAEAENEDAVFDEALELLALVLWLEDVAALFEVAVGDAELVCGVEDGEELCWVDAAVVVASVVPGRVGRP